MIKAAGGITTRGMFFTHLAELHGCGRRGPEAFGSSRRQGRAVRDRVRPEDHRRVGGDGVDRVAQDCEELLRAAQGAPAGRVGAEDWDEPRPPLPVLQ